MAESLIARHELLRTAPQPTHPSSAGSRPGCPSHPWPLCGRSPLPAEPVPSLGSEADRHILFFSPSVLPCSTGAGQPLQPPRFARFGPVPGCPFWPRPGAAGLLRGRLGLSGALEAMKTGTAVGKQRRGWKRGVGSRLHPPVPGGARLPLPGRKGHRRGRAMPDPATLGARCSPGFQPSAGLRECPSRAQLRRPFASAELKAAPASAGA